MSNSFTEAKDSIWLKLKYGPHVLSCEKNFVSNWICTEEMPIQLMKETLPYVENNFKYQLSLEKGEEGEMEIDGAT